MVREPVDDGRRHGLNLKDSVPVTGNRKVLVTIVALSKEPTLLKRSPFFDGCSKGKGR
jgi:hypothetical protein